MKNLIDRELQEYYIQAHKWVFIVFLIISVVLAGASFFSNAAMVLSVMFMLVAFVFFITWNMNKKKYGNKAYYDNGIMYIYNYKNSKIKELNIDSMKTCYLKIAFPYIRGFTYMRCLVLYNNIELYDNMEYGSYWNEPDMLIIQNPELISMIESRVV